MKNNKKIFFEIILISLCLGFLEFTILKGKSITNLIFSIFIAIVSFTIIKQMIKDISLKDDGKLKKIGRIIFLILNILILFIYFYNIVSKNNIKILNNTLIMLEIVIIGYLFVNMIISLKKVLTNLNGKQYLNVKNALFNTIFFILLIILLII